jgi:hypothetical protein
MQRRHCEESHHAERDEYTKRDAERRLWQGHPDGHWRAIRHEPPLTSQESACRRTVCDIPSVN